MQGTHEENVNLSSLAEAEQFLSQFDWYTGILEMSTCTLAATLSDADNLSPDRIRSEVVKHWSAIMSKLPLQQQQDRVFQNSLTAALENVILSKVHDSVFQHLYARYKEEDFKIWNHCQLLTKINLSAEKLEIPEGYAVSFPAAVVEIAALDNQKCPLDKLKCLRSTLDYIEAQIKLAIADTHIATSASRALIPPVTSGDMVPLLAAVLIQARPLHLATNLHYMENYQQTLSPCDPLCTSLDTFQKALKHVLSARIEQEEEELKPVRLGRGMSKELTLEDLRQLSYYTDRVNDGKISDKSSDPITPLECQLHELGEKIGKALDDDVCKSQMETLLDSTEIN